MSTGVCRKMSKKNPEKERQNPRLIETNFEWPKEEQIQLGSDFSSQLHKKAPHRTSFLQGTFLDGQGPRSWPSFTCLGGPRLLCFNQATLGFPVVASNNPPKQTGRAATESRLEPPLYDNPLPISGRPAGLSEQTHPAGTHTQGFGLPHGTSRGPTQIRYGAGPIHGVSLRSLCQRLLKSPPCACCWRNPAPGPLSSAALRRKHSTTNAGHHPGPPHQPMAGSPPHPGDAVVPYAVLRKRQDADTASQKAGRANLPPWSNCSSVRTIRPV